MCIRDRHTLAAGASQLARVCSRRGRSESPPATIAYSVSYTHLQAHETPEQLVWRLPISPRLRSSAASDVYKRQAHPRRRRQPAGEGVLAQGKERVSAGHDRVLCLLYTSPSPRTPEHLVCRLL